VLHPALPELVGPAFHRPSLARGPAPDAALAHRNGRRDARPG
jgi:hypothetical protein